MSMSASNHASFISSVVPMFIELFTSGLASSILGVAIVFFDLVLPPGIKQWLCLVIFSFETHLLWIAKPFTKVCFSCLLYGLGRAHIIPKFDSFTILFGGIYVMNGIIYPFGCYMNFHYTDEHNLNNFLKGVSTVAFYVGTVVFFRHVSKLWSFLGMLLRSPPVIIFTIILLVAIQIVQRMMSTETKMAIREALLNGMLKFAGAFMLYGFRIVDWIFRAVSSAYRGTKLKFNRWEDSYLRGNDEDLPPLLYRPLVGREIRLLKVLRRAPFQRIRCELIHVDLDETPSFEAKSYTWRGETPSVEIWVDGGLLKVTPAVYEILQYRQTFYGSKLFWIDAVCINQDDLEEKNCQVPLMTDIYRRAERVVVWLGPMDLAIDAASARGQLMLLIEDAKSMSTEELYKKIMSHETEGWHALNEMLEHPWFSRVWVIQEVSAAASVNVMYGNICISWSALARGISILNDPQLCGPVQTMQRPSDLPNPISPSRHHARMKLLTNARLIYEIQSQVANSEPIPLKAAVIYGMDFQSTDPRDKIYGMLGFLSDSIHPSLVPDYRKDVVQLYTDAMSHLLSQPARGDVAHMLQYAGTGAKRSQLLEAKNLPSWVADFSNSAHYRWRGRQSTEWVLHNIFDPKLVITHQTNYLQALGSRVDTIKELTTQRWDVGTSTSQPAEMENILSWYYEAKTLAASLSPDTEFPAEVFLSTLTGGKGMFSAPELPDIPATDILAELEHFIQLTITSQPGESDLIERAPLVSRVMFRVGHVCLGNSFAITEGGKMAWVPPLSRVGDEVVFFEGLQFPFLVRERTYEDELGATSHELLGCCYVDGLMDGEAEGLDWKHYFLG